MKGTLTTPSMLRLKESIWDGRIYQTRHLLESGVDVNFADEEGLTPLMRAAQLPDEKSRTRHNLLKLLHIFVRLPAIAPKTESPWMTNTAGTLILVSMILHLWLSWVLYAERLSPESSFRPAVKPVKPDEPKVPKISVASIPGDELRSENDRFSPVRSATSSRTNSATSLASSRRFQSAVSRTVNPSTTSTVHIFSKVYYNKAKKCSSLFHFDFRSTFLYTLFNVRIELTTFRYLLYDSETDALSTALTSSFLLRNQ